MHSSDPAGPAVTVGVLHPGVMGSTVAATARAGGARVLWCPRGRSDATRARAEAAGLEAVDDLEELLDACPVVLSICPPAAAEGLAGDVAALGYRGVFVEANAISRERMLRIADRATTAGGRVVDGSIIGPPPRDGASARLYLSGAPTETGAVAALFPATSPLEVVVLGEALGSASALKMAYAGYQKAARTLAAVAHALAARHGVTEALLAEGRRLTTSPLADPHYLPSVAARAWRWEPEMHEVADILAAEGLPDDLALAAATVLERWEPDRDHPLPLRVVLEQLHDRQA
jgi:3-hydroxyisobutyrate dehydrogenase-like beta-hydroxyacid dehydrogenase